jgi:hypothetical protein
VAASALLVLGSGLRARGGPRGPGSAGAVLRRLALLALAVAAFASNYNLFHRTGLHRHEFFHYYLGSKYFPELGYARLYECSVEALRARGEPAAGRPVEVTDLRAKRRRPARELLDAARPCRPDFVEARWKAFQDDVSAFLRLLGEDGFVTALSDRGYNPSPVWTLVGRPLAERFPVEPAALRMLARLDLLLLLAAFAGIGLAFGLEAACLAAIVWGACGHTGYSWTGDAFLRQLWLTSALGGICLLRRRRAAAGGALLALSASLRVFPVLLLAGPALREGMRLLGRRGPSVSGLHLAAGATATALVLATGATAVAGRGLAAWSEFASNTAALASFLPRNAVGLSQLLAYAPGPPLPQVVAGASDTEDAIQRHKRHNLESRRWLQAAVGILALALFARAVRPGAPGREPPLEGWEIVALGAALIPLLTLPASYYLGFLVTGALLATRRPWLGVWLLAAVLGCALAVACFGHDLRAFLVSSAVVVLYGLGLLIGLQRPAGAAAATRSQ